MIEITMNRDRFVKISRRDKANRFSTDALKALYDYYEQESILQDKDTVDINLAEILDDWTEYTIQDYRKSNTTSAITERLSDEDYIDYLLTEAGTDIHILPNNKILVRNNPDNTESHTTRLYHHRILISDYLPNGNIWYKTIAKIQCRESDIYEILRYYTSRYGKTTTLNTESGNLFKIMTMYGESTPDLVQVAGKYCWDDED